MRRPSSTASRTATVFAGAFLCLLAATGWTPGQDTPPPAGPETTVGQEGEGQAEPSSPPEDQEHEGATGEVDRQPLDGSAQPEPPIDWPREHNYDDGSKLVLYQPQIDFWDNYVSLEARAALAFTPAGGDSPTLGSFHFHADTETNLDERLVRLFNFQLVGARFPSLGSTESSKLIQKLQEILPTRDLIVELDRVLVNLEQGQARVETAEVNVDPPVIFTSSKPAILVLLDGEPILSPIPGLEGSPPGNAAAQDGGPGDEAQGKPADVELKYAVNTNWDLFFEATGSFYLLVNDSWITAETLGGPWSPAASLPAGLQQLPEDGNWEQVRENVPGYRMEPAEMPVVFVSEGPAEMILTDGEPELSLIPGTQLLWVTNTESDLFLSSADSFFYYLVSGRWFKSKELESGEWAFVTPDLPADFAAIPDEHPRGRVLASVPGTPQAGEAVILSQIPQTVEVEKATVEAPEVTYQGEPQFEPIDGTPLAYAANTSNDIIRFGDLYYLCFEGIWFASTSAEGPWLVAEKVPEEIYAMPPSSPVYHTTYVYVQDTSPTHVTYVYTSGYYGVYYSSGCVVYGTGWYYPRYVWWGYYYPVYYYRPVTYGVGAYYNPYTGTYGRGAVAYGPYGGMGRAAAYNPRTGTYARGGAVWGDDWARGGGSAYNPRTGAHGARRWGSEGDEHWGRTGVKRGDEWAKAGHYGNESGTVAGFRTSEGTGAIGYRGDEGSGFIGKGEDSLYAGKDGNVYRRDEDGWSKYEDGDWSSVEKPNREERQEQASERSGDRQERAGDGSAERQERAGETASTADGSRRAEASSARAGQMQDAGGGERARPADSGSSYSRMSDASGGPDPSWQPPSSDRTGNQAGAGRDRGTMDQLNRDAYRRSQGNSRTRDYNNWRSSGAGRSMSGRSFGGRAGGGRRR